MNPGLLGLSSVYTFRNYDPMGRLLWEHSVPNLVTLEGLKDVLTQYFKGSAYTAAWSVGIIDNASYGGISASDTAAKITTGAPGGGTNQWKEVSTQYSQSTRPSLSLGSISGLTTATVNNSLALATYTVTVGFNLKGGFVISNSTKGGTTGKLYGAAVLGSPQVVAVGALTIQITLTAASA